MGVLEGLGAGLGRRLSMYVCGWRNGEGGLYFDGKLYGDGIETWRECRVYSNAEVDDAQYTERQSDPSLSQVNSWVDGE